jgi:SH3-like domain-containing protein
MKSPNMIVFIVLFVLVLGGGFGVFAVRNTFIVENTAAALHPPIVYLTADDINTEPEELVAPEPSATFVKVLPNEVGHLNVRAGAGVNRAKISQVKPGDELEYTEIENNWYHIVLEEGKTGWVSGQYVAETAEE